MNGPCEICLEHYKNSISCYVIESLRLLDYCMNGRYPESTYFVYPHKGIIEHHSNKILMSKLVVDQGFISAIMHPSTFIEGYRWLDTGEIINYFEENNNSIQNMLENLKEEINKMFSLMYHKTEHKNVMLLHGIIICDRY